MQIDGTEQPQDPLEAGEFIRVTKMSPEDRFEYFLQHLKDYPFFYGLFGKNGWIMVQSDDELCLPIWSHQDFVVAWERDDFPECLPKRIELQEFAEMWVPGLEKNNTLLLIFPCGDEEEGIVMSGNEILECIKEVVPTLS